MLVHRPSILYKVHTESWDWDLSAFSLKCHFLYFQRWTPPPLVLELGPLNIVRNISSARTSPGRLMSGTSDFTTRSVHSSRSHHTHPPPPVYGHLINDSNSCFSPSPRSSLQSKPTLVIGKDNPWVYRFKVKKSMNEVNKIMRNGGNRKGGNVRNGNFGLSSHNG